MKIEIKIVVAVTFLLVFFSGLYSQNAVNKPLDLIFENQIKFSAAPVLYDNLKIYNYGDTELKSRPCVSFDANISYYHHIKNGLGINIGVGLTLAPFNINYKFNIPSKSLNLQDSNNYHEIYDSHSEYMQSILVFPLSIQKIFPLKNTSKYYFSIDAGMRLNMIWAYPYSIEGDHIIGISDSAEYRCFSFSLYDTKRFLLSSFFKIGILKVTKKQNTLQCNLVMNFSPCKSGSGQFKFQYPGYESYGQIEQSINYIGIDFTYGLKLSKRLKK